MRITIIGGIVILAIGLLGLASSYSSVRGFLDGAQPVQGIVAKTEYGGRSHTSSMTVEIAPPSPFAGTHEAPVGMFSPLAGSKIALLAKALPGTERVDLRPAVWWELWQAALLWAVCAVIGLVTLLEGLRARQDSPAAAVAKEETGRLE